MASLPIDTLRVSRRLRDVGFSEPQAEAVAFIMSDAREENARAAVTRPELKAELSEFKTDFAEMRTESAKFKAEIREEIRPIKADVLVLKWMAGFGLTIGGAILLKLFALV